MNADPIDQGCKHEQDDRDALIKLAQRNAALFEQGHTGLCQECGSGIKTRIVSGMCSKCRDEVNR